MKDKIPQMTEEQARCVIKIIVQTDEIKHMFTQEALLTSEKECLNRLKQAGYIKNSELEQLVEEAEEEYNNFQPQLGMAHAGRLIIIQREVIQALKKDHPQFGGRK